MAIAAGNTFILKPSERDPSLPVRLGELMLEAGAPKGVLNVVHGDKTAVDAILHHPMIQAVSFVGSSDIAHYVYSTGAANNKRVQAMGGAKNHGIVLPDADLASTVKDLVGAAFGSAGERCMALPVVVPVGKKTADELRERLIAEIPTLKVGVSTDKDAHYGPMVTAAQKQRVLNWIETGVREGSELVVDGRDFKLQGHENGFFVGPTLLDHVKPEMESYKEEIFGPVLQIMRAWKPSKKLSLPSKHQYGNGVAIFFQNGRAARRLRQPGERGHGRHQRADPGAGRLPQLKRLEASGLRRHQPARLYGRPAVLDQNQNRHRPLAGKLAGGRGARGLGVRDPDDALVVGFKKKNSPRSALSALRTKVLSYGLTKRAFCAPKARANWPCKRRIIPSPLVRLVRFVVHFAFLRAFPLLRECGPKARLHSELGGALFGQRRSYGNGLTVGMSVKAPRGPRGCGRGKSTITVFCSSAWSPSSSAASSPRADTGATGTSTSGSARSPSPRTRRRFSACWTRPTGSPPAVPGRPCGSSPTATAASAPPTSARSSPSSPPPTSTPG